MVGVRLWTWCALLAAPERRTRKELERLDPMIRRDIRLVGHRPFDLDPANVLRAERFSRNSAPKRSCIVVGVLKTDAPWRRVILDDVLGKAAPDAATPLSGSNPETGNGAALVKQARHDGETSRRRTMLAGLPPDIPSVVERSRCRVEIPCAVAAIRPRKSRSTHQSRHVVAEQLPQPRDNLPVIGCLDALDRHLVRVRQADPGRAAWSGGTPGVRHGRAGRTPNSAEAFRLQRDSGQTPHVTSGGGSVPVSVADALWRDLLDWITDSATVLDSKDGETIYLSHESREKVVLRFGPSEWAQFVLFGDWATPNGPAVYEPSTSGAALDELREFVGSKGSPIVVRDGRLFRG